MIEPSTYRDRRAQPEVRPRRDESDTELGCREGHVRLLEAIFSGRYSGHGRPMTEKQRLDWMREHCPGTLGLLVDLDPRRPAPQIRRENPATLRPDTFLSGS